MKNRLLFFINILFILLLCTKSFAAYNLEVPVEPWDEYRLQFKNYSKHLLASYDRAFVDDYQGAVREVSRAIELLPDEGIGFAERSKYYRILQRFSDADLDFKTAILSFNKAIDKYSPEKSKRSKKKAFRNPNPNEARRLIATLRYQRGEAYFNFEQYKQASDDFAFACQGGNATACSRIWDVKAIEKRGIQWIPISARQYYDRSSVKKYNGSLISVWVRREESQPVQLAISSENYIQQHIELNCATKEFRLIDAMAVSDGGSLMLEKPTETSFTKTLQGTTPNKLMIILCPPISNR